MGSVRGFVEVRKSKSEVLVRLSIHNNNKGNNKDKISTFRLRIYLVNWTGTGVPTTLDLVRQSEVSDTTLCP